MQKRETTSVKIILYKITWLVIPSSSVYAYPMPKWFRKRLHIRAYTADLAAMNNELERHLAQLRNKKAEVQEDIFDVTAYLLEENIDLYQSIITLYKQEHFRSCLILVRNVLENFVNLQYIYANDAEKRAKNYRLYSMLRYL